MGDEIEIEEEMVGVEEEETVVVGAAAARRKGRGFVNQREEVGVSLTWGKGEGGRR